MTLGNRIKKARTRLVPATTQKDIAAAFGITDKAVSGWERDETVPDIAKFPRLAKILQVPLIWLIDGNGEPPSADDLQTRIDALTRPERDRLAAWIDGLHRRRRSTR